MSFLANLTLQKRIGLLVAIGLTIGLGLFSWLGIQSVNESTQRTLDERLAVSRILASRLDEILNHVLVHLQLAADFEGESPTKTQFQERARELTTMLSKSNFSIEGVYLLDTDGKVLESEPHRSQAIGLAMPKFSSTDARVTKGLSAVSNLAYAPLTGKPVVFVTGPIWDSNGREIEAMSVAIDVNQSGISGFIEPVTLGSTGYIEIVDSNGVVLARTEPGRRADPFELSDHPEKFAMLIAQGTDTVRTCHRCHGTLSNPQRSSRDIIAFAPLKTAGWGVAIRQSENEAFALAEQLRRRLIIIGGIVVVGVFLLVWLVVQGIVRPIKMLTVASTRVAAGDFTAVVPIKRRDEIGRLSTAFSVMTRELDRAQKELVSRNQELFALNSIAATVGQSLELEEVLAKAMQKVLEVNRSEAGCVFLAQTGSNKLKPVSHIGSLALFRCQQSGSAEAGCACHQVLSRGHTLMVNDVSQCPALAEEATTGSNTVCFASVPLEANKKVLGVMNVACSGDRYFTESDFRLLDSIGHHVGLAIENSMLYEETKEKEELRGQLLNATIGAQEEERKRISRELHDGCGQTLTGLIMSIESAENVALTRSPLLREKLASTRLIAVRVLEDMRKLLRGLRPTVLDDLGLVSAIRSYAETNLEAAGVHLDFRVRGFSHRLPPPVETALFRIVQEAINNIARHAGAQTARIHLHLEGSKIRVVVEDDGKGFDVSALSGSGTRAQSLGLLGMRERAALLEGVFSVTSAPGRGTRIVVEVPVDTLPRSEETLDEQQDASVNRR